MDILETNAQNDSLRQQANRSFSPIGQEMQPQRGRNLNRHV
jgi:hypothetical protein